MNTNKQTQVFQEIEDIYTYLLRVYNIQDDFTRCTVWQMVKDGVFNALMEEKGLLPF